MWLTLFMWTLTKHYPLYPPYKFMQPGNRYYLFEDLIRCSCLDVLQTIKFPTLLYTAGGFLSFCLPSTTTVPQQLCTQSSSPAGSSLLAHLHYRDALCKRDVPLATSSAKDQLCCPGSLLALSWEELQPSWISAGLGAHAPAEDEFLQTSSFLFCSLLSQVSSTDLAFGKHCELIRSSSE